MFVLALDTAHAATQVCVFDAEAGRVRAIASRPMAKGHAEALISMIEAALGEAGMSYSDLARISVNCGPGSFAGVRIALAAARGLGLALSLPVIGVSGLAALAAEGADGLSPVIAAIDARRDQVYAQGFGPSGTSLFDPAVGDVEAVMKWLPTQPFRTIGDGAPILAAWRGDITCVSAPIAPSIEWLARLGAAAPAGAPPSPLYLRPPDAKPQFGALVRAS